MNTKVVINGGSYAADIQGTKRDGAWGNREIKSITLPMDYATAAATFVDDVPWSILYQPPEYFDPEAQKTVTPPAEEYDNSDFCVLGDIIVHRDGTVTVKMGKPTFEELYNILKEAAESEPTAEV